MLVGKGANVSILNSGTTPAQLAALLNQTSSESPKVMLRTKEKFSRTLSQIFPEN
ncbi:hypothetical protein L3V86_07295 [Thiotrichales bacterium 19S11-10]|nr:hypothetical protein [Thiotrichales bacterium 19S11-10]